MALPAQATEVCLPVGAGQYLRFGIWYGMGLASIHKTSFDSEVVGMILLALLTFMVMIIYGSITGILLAWLLNHPLQDYKLSPDSAGSRGGGTA